MVNHDALRFANNLIEIGNTTPFYPLKSIKNLFFTKPCLNKCYKSAFYLIYKKHLPAFD